MPSHHQSAAASRKETPECSRASDRFPWLLLRFLPHSCHHLGIPLPIFTLLQFRNYSSSMSIFFVSLLLSVRLYRSLRQIQQEQGVPVVLYGMAHLTFANSNQWGVRFTVPSSLTIGIHEYAAIRTSLFLKTRYICTRLHFLFRWLSIVSLF